MLTVLLSALALCAAEPKPQETADGWRLTVKEEVFFGFNHYTFEFVRGETVVRTKVTHSYNVPTGDSSYDGDLLPIYLVITCKSPAKATAMRNADELISALEAGGFKVSEHSQAPEVGKGLKVTKTTYLVAPTIKLTPISECAHLSDREE